MAASSTKPIRVLLIDDHAILRAGVRMLIDSHPGMKVVGEAGNRAEALTLAASEPCDIVVLDLDLNGENSLDFLSELIGVAKGSHVLILTGVRAPDLYLRAVSQGAMGVVLKDQAAEELLRAVAKVSQGELWLDREIIADFQRQLSRSQEDAEQAHLEAAKIATLTERERQIIALVGEGLKNRQIANRLFISEGTVRNHLTVIFQKLGLSNRYELMVFAYHHHLAKPPV
jgi:RNA polymerase sigma factor (sigma-70 family)